MRTITIVKFCGIPIFTIITFEKGDEHHGAVKLSGRISQEIDRDDSFRQEENMPQFDLHDGKKVRYTPAASDADGNAVAIETGTLTGVSSDENLATVTIEGDEAVISSVPGPGTGPVDVTFTADVDLGEGVNSQTEVFNINVIAGAGTALAGTIGPEEDR